MTRRSAPRWVTDPVEPPYEPRFIHQRDIAELVNLYHLARTALSGTSPSRADRMTWAAAEYHKAHPEVSTTAAFKDLGGLLA